MKNNSEIGLIGLGVMGKSLAINFANHQIPISVYNRHLPKVEENVAQQFLEANYTLTNILGFDDLNRFVDSLSKPRNILLMVNAGSAVDAVIDSLIPLLDKEDMIMDGGNSHYLDTANRLKKLHHQGIHYIGIGISGGEEGAKKGPSLMPGGENAAYQRVKDYLNMIAAKDARGNPCNTYIGSEGSGHFVKMIHNGIEYAEMQIIAECYQLLRIHQNMTPLETAAVFEIWLQNGWGSYLLEITISILKKKENKSFIIDSILDVARQKGTGGWSTHAALQLGQPFSTISEAVMARHISTLRTIRLEASSIYENSIKQKEIQIAENTLKDAYQASRIINHAIGFEVMKNASKTYHWGLQLSEIARIWTNGCIIRSPLMEDLISCFDTADQHILLHPKIIPQLQHYRSGFATTIAMGLQAGCAMPVMSAALNYFNGICSARCSANMIQAQRDYFGAHTYQRIDRPESEFFHTIWESSSDES